MTALRAPRPGLRLGVNIDHVATIRNARGVGYPDPVRAALLAQDAGADGITAHLREDRRHITDDDIARLSAELTIPLAFRMVAESEENLESRIRHALRDKFHEEKFLQKIIPDLEKALHVKTDDAEIEFDFDDAAPGGLWNGGDSSVGGGINWADVPAGDALEEEE